MSRELTGMREKVKDLLEEDRRKTLKIEELSWLNFKMSETSKNPYAGFQKLHADVWLLEEKLVWKNKRIEEEARKNEITLNGEITVRNHEIAMLKDQLNSKERQLLSQRTELDEIISGMRLLKA